MAKNIVEYVISLTDKISPTLKKIQSNVGLTDSKMKKLDNSISGLGVGIAALAIGYGAIKAINIAGEFELAGVAFETMLGSVEKGQKLLKELDVFATKTPFSIKGVQESAKQLLAVGVTADNMIPTLKALGDVSAGLNVPISRLALNYGQVKSNLKLTGRELKDFTQAGVPLISQLAKQLKVSESAISGMVSKGQIGFPEVEKAFIGMSSKGGKFFNLMDRSNKTFLGGVNEMQENIQILARTIGNTLIPIIRPLVDLIARMVKFTQNHKTAVAIWTKILLSLVGVIALVVIVVKAWSVAQAILNVIMLLNPVGLIIAGVLLLIAVIAAIVTSVNGWGEQWKVLKNIFTLSLTLMKNHFLIGWKTISAAFLTALDIMKIAWLKAKKVLGIGDSNQTQIDALTQGIKNRTDEIKNLANEQLKTAKKLKEAFKFKLSFDGSGIDDVTKKLTSGFAPTPDSLITGDSSQTKDTKVTSAAPKVFNININLTLDF